MEPRKAPETIDKVAAILFPELQSISNWRASVNNENSFARSQRPVPESQPLGFNTMENTDLTRGSSATVESAPPLASPQPASDLPANIEDMSNKLRNTAINQGTPSRTHKLSFGQRNSILPSTPGHNSNPRMGMRSMVSPETQGVKISHHSRGSSGYQGSQASRYTGNAVPNGSQFAPTQAGSSSHRSTFDEHFQARIDDVQNLICGRKDIPQDVRDTLSGHLRNLSLDFNDQHGGIVKEINRLRSERDNLRRQLQLAKAQDEKLSAEKKELVEKHLQSIEDLEEAGSRWNQIQEELLDHIARQQEQIDAKRALWLEANPGSSARRDAIISLRDPFQSPSAKQTPSYTGGAMSTMKSPSIITPGSGMPFYYTTGPPKMEFGENLVAKVPATTYTPSTTGSAHNSGSSSRAHRSRCAMPSGPPPVSSAFKRTAFPSEPGRWGNSRSTFPTEPGSPKPRFSNAVVLHQTEEDLASEYKTALTELYDMIENWVRKYTSHPNQVNDHRIATSNDVLWAYIMNCTYPGHRQDSHTHAVTLLNSPDTRFWFVMRMATQYCVKDILTIKAFRAYSKDVEKTIDTGLLKLQERGLNNEARQQYIDEGSYAVQSVIAAKDYLSFRSTQLGVHTKALRDMLGPLLDEGAERKLAGVDLGGIVVHCWELSCKMYTARLTFQIYFPETNGKFTASTMNSKDLADVDPMKLQIEQVRLKLVITPVITMRDDRGVTIKAKAIHSADVLLMK